MPRSSSVTRPAQPHPLLRYLHDAADGRFPPVDGQVTVVPGLGRGLECSVAFTGHAVVATALRAEEIRAQRADGFGGAMAPGFLRFLAGPAGWIGVLDASMVARGVGGPAELGEREGLADHYRVRHARELREDVRVFGDERGFVTLAAGLAGRLELSIEVDAPSGDSPGRGRGLLLDALTLVPSGEPVFAAVSPGNARSLRAFLAAGFTPIGSEVIVRPDRLTP